MIQQKRTEIKAIMLFVLLFGTSIVTMTSYSMGAQSYTVGVQRGTDLYEVSTYNETEWSSVVGVTTQPDDLLGGEANKLGAKSKITIRSVDNVEWGTYDSLSILFNVLDPVSDDVAKMAAFVTAVGFNETNINGTYPGTYNVAIALASEWAYSAEGFEETPDNSFKLIPVLKDPTNFSEALADYNAWVDTVNPNPIMLGLGLDNYTKYTGEEFLMMLINNGLAMALPVTEYLTAIVGNLSCENVTVSGNSFIIEKVGIENYTIEVTYSDQGVLTSYVVKNLEGAVMYAIGLNTFDDLVLMIIELSIVVAIAGIVILSIRKKKKTRRI